MAEQEQATETATETVEAGAEQEQEQTTEGDAKTETTDEIQPLVDRAVSKALETARTKWEREREQQTKAAEDAARREQLEKEENYKALLAEERARIAALEADNERRDYEINARKLLDELGMSGFAEDIVGSPEPLDKTRERAERLKAKLDAQTQSAVEKRLNTGDPLPKTTNKPDNGQERVRELANQFQPKYLRKKKAQ